jgi:hypothetical protein
MRVAIEVLIWFTFGAVMSVLVRGCEPQHPAVCTSAGMVTQQVAHNRNVWM